jgi:hypothetical protein
MWKSVMWYIVTDVSKEPGASTKKLKIWGSEVSHLKIIAFKDVTICSLVIILGTRWLPSSGYHDVIRFSETSATVSKLDNTTASLHS